MTAIRHVFVEEIPEQIEPNKLYISILYRTAVHKCCCGCGHEVVTPMSPTDWELRFNGAAVSLYPSIGNWSFPCQSHYFIDRDRVRWAARMSETQIRAVRDMDRQNKDSFYDETPSRKTAPDQQHRPTPTSELAGILSRMREWLRR